MCDVAVAAAQPACGLMPPHAGGQQGSLWHMAALVCALAAEHLMLRACVCHSSCPLLPLLLHCHMRVHCVLQVNSAARQGDQVELELEPAKGGDKKSMTVDVVLVSAGTCGERVAVCGCAQHAHADAAQLL